MSYCCLGHGWPFAWMSYIRMPDAAYFNAEHMFFNNMHYERFNDAYTRGSVIGHQEYFNEANIIDTITEYPEYLNKGYPRSYYTSCPKGFNAAYAMIIAGPDYPSITGLVTFADTPAGTMVCVDVKGLPEYRPATDDKSPVGPFGFHLHEGCLCEVGGPEKPFEGCGGHWNPTKQPHGNHAGDFPVLVSSNGRARMCFVTDRFTVDEIIGRTVIIHENPDDYRSQPAGNSGRRIACGSIRPWDSVQWLS